MQIFVESVVARRMAYQVTR